MSLQQNAPIYESSPTKLYPLKSDNKALIDLSLGDATLASVYKGDISGVRGSHIVFHDVLDEILIDRILSEHCSSDAKFIRYGFVSNGEPGEAYGFRHSFVRRGVYLKELGEMLSIFAPFAFSYLNLTPIATANLEMQLVGTANQGFLAKHNDTRPHPKDYFRYLTFVFYMHTQVKQFEGGELVIYDTADGSLKHTIHPTRNSMVMFSSRKFHEVNSVSSKSSEFINSRFTLNGWICKRARAQYLLRVVYQKYPRIFKPVKKLYSSIKHL